MLTRRKLLRAAATVGYLRADCQHGASSLQMEELDTIAELIRWADSAAFTLDDIRRRLCETGQMGHPCMPRINALVGTAYRSEEDGGEGKTDNVGA